MCKIRQMRRRSSAYVRDHPCTVGFKESSERVESIDRRAKQLGVSRSDYLRYLVDRDLLAN